MALMLTSPAFGSGGMVPVKYTCDGERKLSPPLLISGVPGGAKSLVLVMDDPDIPNVIKEAQGIDVFDHWILFNIPPETRELLEGQTIGASGLNSSGGHGYTGPCPPPEYEPKEHRYIFTLYALKEMLHFDAPPTKQQVEDALAPMLIEKTELVGRYSRK